MTFSPTRNAALTRLNEFLPLAGSHYTSNRNYDDGVPREEARRNVSQLSPWLHAGVISEKEVLEAVLAKHSLDEADQFIAEVFWRVYFKGYLEQRPSIWLAFCKQRTAALGDLERNAGLQTAYLEAVEGRTGIEAFNHWAHELVETGYLHNHARMWFASIWIFTLKLDWTLGADFFLRHLIDADAASNTLSWRWVGGLHTKGKTYLARADNIARYTANQSGGPLSADRLAEEADALVEMEEHNRSVPDLPAPLKIDQITQPYALILHDEAASHVYLNLPWPPAVVIAAARPSERSPCPVGSPAEAFARGAVQTGAEAASKAFDCEVVNWTNDNDLASILHEAGLEHVLLPYLPTGWTKDALRPQLQPMLTNGHAIEILDDLSRATWPWAKAGFFGIKKKIGPILSELGIIGH
ncbi:FAD-binding domain-containing protein [Erythrobacter crassostreae]|uniref:DNA photolyase n=1 Tax=Erythrobacter crassostreae TaxID=2828328 RepID=A0A9X1F106_9SPHN|nr:FAD-binding domain-containing protein [Erythrobacter crassostrea]MBV7258036.1 DNA photolyase [Erythrobacter crassostrea]